MNTIALTAVLCATFNIAGNAPVSAQNKDSAGMPAKPSAIATVMSVHGRVCWKHDWKDASKALTSADGKSQRPLYWQEWLYCSGGGEIVLKWCDGRLITLGGYGEPGNQRHPDSWYQLMLYRIDIYGQEKNRAGMISLSNPPGESLDANDFTPYQIPAITPEVTPMPPLIPEKGAPGVHLRYRILVARTPSYDPEGSHLLPQVSESIQARLIEKLEKTDKFVIEYTGLAGVGFLPTERNPADPSGLHDTPKDYLLLPAKITVKPEIAGHGSGFKGIFGMPEIGRPVTLDVRVMDARSGDTTGSAVMIGTLLNQYLMLGDYPLPPHGPNGQRLVEELAVDRALDVAVANIIYDLSKRPWSALVTEEDVTTNTVVIDAGMKSGVEIGQVFDVYRAVPLVKDPKSDMMIAHGHGAKVGRLKVARVGVDASYANILDGQDFRSGDVVQAAP